MSENMEFWPKTFWPPQSPDLNPLDYSIWWQVESKACKVRHKNLAELKLSVEEQWERMDKQYIVDVCKSFRKRVKAVIDANGGHIHK